LPMAKECERCAILAILEKRIEEQTKRIEELEKRLLAYENAHTPPSRKGWRNHYPKREKSGNKVGAPLGHVGATRPQPKPTETKALELSFCPDCKQELGVPLRMERRVIEEIPNPQPLRVIEFLVPHYRCKKCKKEVIASHPELPKEGRLGNNLQAQIVLAKQEDRLTSRKIAQQLNREYNLDLSSATILDVQERVAEQLEPDYKKIKIGIKKSKTANADETGSKLNGLKHWLWLFMSQTSVLFVFHKRRESKVVKEILGKEYQGVLTCDGLKAYKRVIKIIQRCWAHLLRDAKFLAQKYEGQARVLYNSLCELFEKVKTKSIEFETAVAQMRMFFGIAKSHKELRKIAVLLENGLEDWFTCLRHEGIELTNNRAERQLREFVVQRKIYPTFRSEKGMETAQILMSVLATWKLQGKNPLQMLKLRLSS